MYNKNLKLFLFILLICILKPNNIYAENLLIDNFNNYKTTKQFLKTWKSRSKGYKKTLKKNSYYYYIKNESSHNKVLCSSLRKNPHDFIRTDIKKVQHITNRTSKIKSVSIYKDYWDKEIEMECREGVGCITRINNSPNCRNPPACVNNQCTFMT